jgi:hypothetical protein
MSTHPNNHTTTTTPRMRIAKLAGSILIALSLVLIIASIAWAGTYSIANCPSAPTANGNSGPWSVFGSPQNAKGSCAGGAGDYIGPRGGSMSAGSEDGVRATVPSGSGITIRKAELWWAVPHQTSGADTFAVILANGAVFGESNTPLGPTGPATEPDTVVLPSTTTNLELWDYCSGDDGANGCTFGSGENPNLELYGAQLTLADSTLPTGSVTGGSLTAGGALTATQTLAYNASDTSSGVKLVKLLVDGSQVAENSYLSQCPYQDWLACPETLADTIAWNTATVADGQHSLEAIVETQHRTRASSTTARSQPTTRPATPTLLSSRRRAPSSQAKPSQPSRGAGQRHPTQAPSPTATNGRSATAKATTAKRSQAPKTPATTRQPRT